MGKKEDPNLWKHWTRVHKRCLNERDRKKDHVKCVHCGNTQLRHAVKCRTHVINCLKCPQRLKQVLIGYMADKDPQMAASLCHLQSSGTDGSVIVRDMSPNVVIKMNDMFEEIMCENKRLLRELSLSQKCVKLMQNYRKCLLELHSKCVCIQNDHFKPVVHQLETKYHAIDERLSGGHDNNEVGVAAKERVVTIRGTKRKLINKSTKSDPTVDSDDNIADETNDDFGDNSGDDDKGSDYDYNPSEDPNNKKFHPLTDNESTDETIGGESTVNPPITRVSFDTPKNGYKRIGRRVVCEWDGCGKTFRKPCEMWQHFRRMHTNDRPFRCQCSAEFALEIGLKVHKRTSLLCRGNFPMKRKNYVCERSGCGLRFNRRRALESHTRRGHPQKGPFVCTGCGNIFLNQMYLREHEKSCEKLPEKTRLSTVSLIICTTCGDPFDTLRELTAHIKEMHTNELPFMCTKCDQKFAIKCNLRKHMLRTHFKAKGIALPRGSKDDDEGYALIYKFCCDWEGCGMRFKFLNVLRSHYFKTHQTETPFGCNKCDKRFTQRFELSKHKAISHSTGAYKLFQCDYDCGQQFVYESQLIAHTRKVHTGDKPYECGVCGNKFAMKEYLQKHLSRNHDRTYRCETCDHSFQSGLQLNEHYKTTPEHMKYQCLECGKRFKQSGILRTHMRHKHTTERRFVCQHIGCGKAFKTNGSLSKHTRIHTNPFICEWPGCDKAFGQNKNLEIHRLLHLDVRDYGCDYPDCVKRFRTQKQLEAHQERHKAVKKYECSWPACEQSFATHESLRTHTYLHQDLRPFKCRMDECDRASRSSAHLLAHYHKVHKMSTIQVRQRWPTNTTNEPIDS